MNAGYPYFRRCQEIESKLPGEDLSKAVTNLNLAIVNYKMKKYRKFFLSFDKVES